MKTRKRRIALFLSVLMLFCGTFSVSAASDGSGGSHILLSFADELFDLFERCVFGLLGSCPAEGIPTAEEYMAQPSPYFYPGTDGKLTGTGWSCGYATRSIIPTAWRYNADGKPDPQGYCFKSLRCTGGYQKFVRWLYTDQLMHVMILSAGSDRNGNKVPDILLFISVDGVGISSKVCREIRRTVEETLEKDGITKADILSCNVSASHGHACLDTQGMHIVTLFRNKWNKNEESDLGLNVEMEQNLYVQAAAAVQEAYGKMEKGTLSYFETEPIGGCGDDIDAGIQTQKWFSCFLFCGESGAKTILADIGAHPVRGNSGKYLNHMLCADYPYYVGSAMRDAGYNFVFTQGAQALVSSATLPESGEPMQWANERGLSREDWAERYGKAHTELYYKNAEVGEPKQREYAANGYALAHRILDTIPQAKPVKPILNIQNEEIVLPLDYGIMYVSAVKGVLGMNTVRSVDSETGYGIAVEIGCMQIGEDVTILTVPGELSPAIAYGSAEGAAPKKDWQGATSWSGEAWSYPTLQDMVRTATGDPDRHVVIMGITNDAVSYILPDTCTPKALLAPIFFYPEGGGDLFTAELVISGRASGRILTEAFQKMFSGSK